jgi:hypothetical protein
VRKVARLLARPLGSAAGSLMRRVLLLFSSVGRGNGLFRVHFSCTEKGEVRSGLEKSLRKNRKKTHTPLKFIENSSGVCNKGLMRAHPCAKIKANPLRGGGAKPRASYVWEIAGLPSRKGGEVARPRLVLKIGTYVAYGDHLRQLGVADDELQVEEG